MLQKGIVKVLSANDVGATGGHQDGLLIPKRKEFLQFFPGLDNAVLNPRAHIVFVEPTGRHWEFAFIYYNNALFGKTRNEYRLTRMSRYMREVGACVGDEIILTRQGECYSIDFRRAKSAQVANGTLRLGSTWRVVPMHGR
jgi:hypothetical protein